MSWGSAFRGGSGENGSRRFLEERGTPEMDVLVALSLALSECTFAIILVLLLHMIFDAFLDVYEYQRGCKFGGAKFYGKFVAPLRSTSNSELEESDFARLKTAVVLRILTW